MSKSKITPIVVKVKPPRKGHYNFHNGKCKFDSRAKRLRTRASQQRFAIND